MTGFLLTILASSLMAYSALGILSRWQANLDPAEKLGTAGLVGLGITGTFIGLGGLMLGHNWALATLVFLLPGVYLAVKNQVHVGLKPSKPEGPALIALAGLCLLFLFPLAGTLAPSTSLDWDSLAYHLAVPKLWLESGSFQPLLWVHHSFFPAAFDALFVPGLAWGDQAGAKAFMVVALLFCCLAVFGLARRQWGADKAWWAPILLAGSPVVLWESGTAYIDVPHGVLGVLAVWYFAEYAFKSGQQDTSTTPQDPPKTPQNPLILGAILLALCLGSKFTGLQAFLLLGLVYLAISFKQPKKLLQGVVVASIAVLVIAGGWYVRNIVLTGNPVRPFFSSIFPTKGWDKWRADTYSNEQQTFGVGRTERGRDPLQIGNAVLGLAVQPGRFVNPAQTEGGGFPFGAVGAATMLVLLSAALAPTMQKSARALLAWVGLLLIAWFFLSQQSRYMTYLPAAAALLLPAVMARWKQLAVPLAAMTAAQAAYTAWMLYTVQAQDQLRVVTGQISSEDYLKATTPFAANAAEINQLPDVTNLALYDEVFGFYLNKPYFWANPGHVTDNSPEPFQTGADYVRGLPQKPSHVYMSLSPQFLPPEARDKFLATAGLAPGDPYTEQEKQEMFANPDLKWRWLIADAVRSGALTPEKSFRSAILFKVNE